MRSSVSKAEQAFPPSVERTRAPCLPFALVPRGEPRHGCCTHRGHTRPSAIARPPSWFPPLPYRCAALARHTDDKPSRLRASRSRFSVPARQFDSKPSRFFSLPDRFSRICHRCPQCVCRTRGACLPLAHVEVWPRAAGGQLVPMRIYLLSDAVTMTYQ